MKILIVEDDFISRRLLLTMLNPYGSCDISVNGTEALEAFKIAQEEVDPYNLICLDIMMPEMDGQEVLKEIRRIENKLEIAGSKKVKVIMTTALDDFDNIKAAFEEKCDAYLVKPINKDKFLDALRKVGAIN